MGLLNKVRIVLNSISRELDSVIAHQELKNANAEKTLQEELRLAELMQEKQAAERTAKFNALMAEIEKDIKAIESDVGDR